MTFFSFTMFWFVLVLIEYLRLTRRDYNKERYMKTLTNIKRLEKWHDEHP